MTQEFRRQECIAVLWNYNIYIVYSFQTHEQTFPVFLIQVRMLFSPFYCILEIVFKHGQFS